MRRKRCGYVLCLLTLLLVLILAGFCVKRFRLYVVLSGSMEPALKTGGVILTDLKEKDAEVGDVITFQKDERTVTHRVAGKTDEGYLTKGDANEEIDRSFTAFDEVLGTVVFYVPYLGYGIVWIQEYKMYLFGCGITVLLVLFLLPDMKRKKKSTGNRKEQKL